MSTSQGSLPHQIETTSKPDSDNATTLKQDSDDAKNLKQDSDPHLQEKTPSDIETTSQNKQDLAAEAQTRVQEITSGENETASKDSSPPKSTATHEEEGDGNKYLKEEPAKGPEIITSENKPDLAAEAQTRVQEITSSENKIVSKDSSLPKNTATHEEEADDNKYLKEEPAKGPETIAPENKPDLAAKTQTRVQEITSSENETVSKDSPPKNTATHENEADDNKCVEEEPAKGPKKSTSENKHDLATEAQTRLEEITSAENETASKDSSPPKDTATHEKEADGNKCLEDAAETQTGVQEFTSGENETASKDSSPPKDTATHEKEADGNKCLEDAAEAQARVPEITSGENKTASKDSSPPENTATHEEEADGNKYLKEEPAKGPEKITSENNPDLAAEAQTPVQEITSGENETASKDSSPPKNTAIHKKEADGNKYLKDEHAKCPKIIAKFKKLINLAIGSRQKPLPKPPVASNEVLPSLIRAEVEYIEKVAQNLGKYNEQLKSVLNKASVDLEELEKQGTSEDYAELRKAMIKLKLQIFPKLRDDKDEKERYKNLQLRYKVKEKIPENLLRIMPQLHKNRVFENSIEFKDFEARYNQLTRKQKLCLLCFSIFPEKAVIKKRLMLHWWVAEGFVSEDGANDQFMKLIREGFIEPVSDNKSSDIGCCRMHPFYRSVLVTLAERAKFFNFVANGAPTQNFQECFQACLVGEGLISYDDLVAKSVTVDDPKAKSVTVDDPKAKSVIDDPKAKSVTVDDLEKIHLLINVNEPTLDFKDDWFKKMANVNILYLGRWSVEPTDHREVEDTVFLMGLENMKYMNFLSLQGVSNIISLPKSILQLTNLKILDLRACDNLETIPEGIGLLKSLTHLDMSECYLLNHMPKSLSLLTSLKVLKGFFVGSEKRKSSCTLDDLKKLENLIKLCIYTDLEKFPEENNVKALGNLRKLEKLTITWGGKALRAADANVAKTSDGDKKQQERKTKETSEVSNGSDSESTHKLPSKLKKLDLKCFPMSKTPNWLALKNLKDLNLEKLYIRGGKFADLGQYQDTDDWNVVKKHEWKVKVLRLKYLSEIEMEWRQLQELFPRLVYLEQVSCPKLSLVPCDANGVWINETKRKVS